MRPELVAKFVSTLMHSRNQAHIFHLQTTSYAAHKALQGYYDDIVDLIDSYVEMYQGRYGILTGYSVATQIYDESSVMKYFGGLQTFVDQVREELPQHGELNNTVDEISGLIASTIYKLKFLQ
jgi:hypothetical protein